MKKTLLTLIFASLIDFNFNAFSWDTTAAKFYPLAIGNLWSYHQTNYNWPNCSIYNSYDYLIRIDSLVLRPNGKRYYKFSDGSLIRIDSATMNVYRYSGTNECLTDSLLARKNDTVRICQYGPGVITDTAHVVFAGTDRRKLRLRANFIGEYYHDLVEGLGFYYFRECEGSGTSVALNGCIINGIQYGTILGVENISAEIPEDFKLYQNYPNPFNPATHLRFEISDLRFVMLKIYDILGREIQTLVNEPLQPGTYEVTFVGEDFPSGIYYYSLLMDSYKETKKMVLLK